MLSCRGLSPRSQDVINTRLGCSGPSTWDIILDVTTSQTTHSGAGAPPIATVGGSCGSSVYCRMRSTATISFSASAVWRTAHCISPDNCRVYDSASPTSFVDTCKPGVLRRQQHRELLNGKQPRAATHHKVHNDPPSACSVVMAHPQEAELVDQSCAAAPCCAEP